MSQITSSALLGTSIKDMEGILICITAADNVSLDETDTINSPVLASALPDAFVIYGVNFDERMDDGMKVVLLATKKRG